MALQDLMKNDWFKNLGIPAIGGLAEAGINFGMMAYQNKFNAKQAQIAREWNQEMDNTKYQRQVADMKAAGVNPALAMNGGVTTQAGSNATAQGATPAYMNLSSMANMVQALSQARLNDSQAKNIDTDTKVKEQQAGYYSTLNDKEVQLIESIKIDNKYKDQFWQLNIKGKEIENNLTDAKVSETYQNIEKLKSEIKVNIAKAATEEEKVKLMITEELLNRANANRVWALLEYEKNYMAAKTDESKASATLMLVQAAWQKGLIDNGAIDATIKKLYAEANEADAKAVLDEVRYRLGMPQAEVENKRADTAAKIANMAATVISALGDAVGKIVSSAASGGSASGGMPTGAFGDD